MKIKKITIAFMLSLTLLLSGVGVAFAMDQPSSGNWERGVWQGSVHSNFYHVSKTHGSSSRNGAHIFDVKEHIAAGYWSYTGVWATPWGNESYWSW